MSEVKNSRVEDELDAIRLDLYEKTKGMTVSETTIFIKKEIAQTVKKYNMPTLARPASALPSHGGGVTGLTREEVGSLRTAN